MAGAIIKSVNLELATKEMFMKGRTASGYNLIFHPPTVWPHPLKNSDSPLRKNYALCIYRSLFSSKDKVVSFFSSSILAIFWNILSRLSPISI